MNRIAGFLPVLLAGCASVPGQGFGTVADATLFVRWQGQGRAPVAEPTTWLTAGHRFRIADRGLRVRTGPLVLEGTGGSMTSAGPAAAFDPARPPAGFTLCHNGHCHATDGRLVPYEQVPLELARNSGSLVTTPFMSLLPAGSGSGVGPGAPESATPLSCVGCAMPEGQLLSVALPIAEVTLEGSLTSRDPDAPLVGGARAFAVALTDPGLTLRDVAPLTLRWARPERIRVEATLSVPEALLDGLPWERLATDQPAGTLAPGADAASREALLAALALSRLSVRYSSPTP